MVFKDNQEVVINEEAMYDKATYKNPVYIVLMHSGTPLANLIKKVTKDTFSHACIAFNSKLDPLYSFGQKGDRQQTGLGFSISSPHEKFFTHYKSFYSVFVMYVTDSAMAKIKERLSYFETNVNKFKYDILGLVDIFFGKASESHTFKWFCSRFVMDLINCAQTLSKVPSLWKPQDITQLENISIVNRGFDFYKYNEKITKHNEQLIKNGTYDEDKIAIGEYTLYDGEYISEEVKNPYESINMDSAFSRMKISDAVVRIYGNQIPQLGNVKITRDTLGYVWLDGNSTLVGILNMEEKDDGNKWITVIRLAKPYETDNLYSQMLQTAISNRATNIKISTKAQRMPMLLKKKGFKKYKTTQDFIYYEHQ